MTTQAGRAFYDRQIALLESGDVDTLVAQQYHEDAALIGFDFSARGRNALREHFQGYLKQLGSLHVLSTDRFTEDADSIFFEATVRTDHGIAKVYDVLMLRDDKATHHFTGLISITPFEGAEAAS